MLPEIISGPQALPGGVTPSLMLGLAGIGYFYLRLHSPTVPSILLVRPEEWQSVKRNQ